MNLRTVLLFGIAGMLLLVLLKAWKSELSPLVKCSILLLLFGAALRRASPLFSELFSLAERYSVQGFFSTLWRGAGIALAVSLASLLCREAKEDGIADGLEFFGKIELLLLALPALSELLSLAEQLFDLGGLS